jgi:hypothetical protein
MKIGHNLLMVSLLTHRPDTLAFVAVIGLLATCGSVKAAPLRIMPLGDSITAGYTNNPLSPPPLRSKGAFKALPPKANS